MNMLSLFPLIPLLMMLGLWISKSTRQIRAVMVAGSSLLLVLAVGFAVTAPKKPGEPSELKEVLQEAAEAMSLDKETMEKEVEQAVSAFEENIGAEELDGGEKQ